MKTKKWFWFWLILTAGATAFVIYNGLQGAEDSLSASDSVIDFIRPVLEWMESLVGKANWDFWVRKAAHFTEYAVLSVCANALAEQVKTSVGRPFIAHAVLYGLLIAVTDEFLQGFVGRTSAVTDVLIDFSGCLFGALLVACFVCIRQQWQAKKGTKS
jgi:VanZ family protein